MATNLTVLGVVLASEASLGSVTQVPRLPPLQSLLPCRSQPGGCLLLVFHEGPGQVFHLDELPVECGGGIQVVVFDQLYDAADQRRGGFAEVAESDKPIIAVAKRRGAVDTLWPEQVSADPQSLARAVKPDG